MNSFDHPSGFIVEPGRWYVAEYGFGCVTGPCISVTSDGAILAFRWGGPFREKKFVGARRIMAEVPPPWRVRLWRRLTSRGAGDAPCP